MTIAAVKDPISNNRARLVKGLLILVSLYGVFYVLEFIILAAVRSYYPFELEWIEGAYVDQIRWIHDGNFPYSTPSLSFIPTSKTPFFFYLSAVLTRFTPGGFFTPRLLSILAAIGCFVILYLLISRRTNQRTAGLIAAGLFAASYRFTGAWMDLAKTDTLFLFITLAAFWVSCRYPRRWGFFTGAILFVLAFLTKQLALPIILVTGVISLVTTRGRSWPLWLLFCILGAAAFWGLESISNGWFSFYTFDTSLQHPRTGDVWLFWKQLASVMWPSLLLASLLFALLIRDAKKDFWNNDITSWQYLGFAAALLATSWGIHLKTWTYDNGYMPATLGLALLAGLAYSRVNQTHVIKKWFSNHQHLIQGALLTLLAVQYTLLFYNPIAQLPLKNNRDQASQFVEFVSELQGEVWVFNHGYFNYLAGKSPYFHSAPFGDIAASAPTAPDTALRREIVLAMFSQALISQHYDWIIVDRLDPYWLPYYIAVSDISYEFYPMTGVQVRPQFLLARNPIRQQTRLPLDDPTYNSLFVEGWGPADEPSRLVLDESAIIQVALEQEREYKVIVDFEPICVQNQPVVQKLSISWNQDLMTTADIQSCSPYSQEFTLPAGSISGVMDQLSFHFEHQADPGESIDKAGLAHLLSIDFIPEEPTT